MGPAVSSGGDCSLHPQAPDTYWIFIILFLGPIGAVVYLVVEALPDFGILGQSFKAFPRRKRIRSLEIAILDNPSAGNFEELGDLYLEDGKLQMAREAFNQGDRGALDDDRLLLPARVCAIELGDAPGALPDLERVVGQDPDHDFLRAPDCLRMRTRRPGRGKKSEALFRRATVTSTLSETYLNFADLLAAEGRNQEAREWAQKVLNKEATMPGYLRRRERPWFRRQERR